MAVTLVTIPWVKSFSERPSPRSARPSPWANITRWTALSAPSLNARHPALALRPNPELKAKLQEILTETRHHSIGDQLKPVNKSANNLGAKLLTPFLIAALFSEWVSWLTFFIFLAIEYGHELLHLPFTKLKGPAWWNILRFAAFSSPPPIRHLRWSFTLPLMGSSVALVILISGVTGLPTFPAAYWVLASLLLNMNPFLRGADLQQWLDTFSRSHPASEVTDRQAVGYTRLLVLSSWGLYLAAAGHQALILLANAAQNAPLILTTLIAKVILATALFPPAWSVTQWFYWRSPPPPPQGDILRSNPPKTWTGELKPNVHYHRSLFISDLHMFTKAFKAQYFLDFLAHNEANAIYIVGDFIDFQEAEGAGELHAEVLAELLRRAERGVDIYWIAGNHDEVIKKYLPLFQGKIHIVRELEYVPNDGTITLVRHGDEEDVSLVGPAAHLGSLLYNVLRGLSDLNHRIRHHWQLPYWSLDGVVKQWVKNVIRDVTGFDVHVAHAAARRGYAQQIHGHDHTPGKREMEVDIDGEKKTVTLYDTGDFVSANSYWSESFDGHMELGFWNSIRSQTPPKPKLRFSHTLFAFFFPAWLKREGVIKPFVPLMVVKEITAKNQDAIAYSWMKLGRLQELTYFGDRLIESIRQRLQPEILENPEEWVVVGIEHRALRSASSELARYVASRTPAHLGLTEKALPILFLTSERAHGSSDPYTCVPMDQRGDLVRPAFDDPLDALRIRGRKIILIDDGVESGETQRAMAAFLAKHGAGSVYPFVVMTFQGQSQDAVNRAALTAGGALPVLRERLADPLRPYTARLIQWVGELSSEEFALLIQGLPEDILLHLYLAALTYMGRWKLDHFDTLVHALTPRPSRPFPSHASLQRLSLREKKALQRTAKWLTREFENHNTLCTVERVTVDLEHFGTAEAPPLGLPVDMAQPKNADALVLLHPNRHGWTFTPGPHYNEYERDLRIYEWLGTLRRLFADVLGTSMPKAVEFLNHYDIGIFVGNGVAAHFQPRDSDWTSHHRGIFGFDIRIFSSEIVLRHLAIPHELVHALLIKRPYFLQEIVAVFRDLLHLLDIQRRPEQYPFDETSLRTFHHTRRPLLLQCLLKQLKTLEQPGFFSFHTFLDTLLRKDEIVRLSPREILEEVVHFLAHRPVAYAGKEEIERLAQRTHGEAWNKLLKLVLSLNNKFEHKMARVPHDLPRYHRKKPSPRLGMPLLNPAADASVLQAA